MLDDSDEEEALLLCALLIKSRRTESPKVVRKKKKVWNYNLDARSKGEGEYHRLCEEMSLNENSFYEYFHMSQESFEELHDKLVPRISKMHTNFRKAITARERLIVCLRYLATGDTFGFIATSFQLGRSTVSNIIGETCKEIYNVLHEEYMPEPTQKTWLESEKGYQDIWNFPNCVGNVDGRHVNMKCPIKNIRYDLKNSKIVLMSIIDPWCKFTAIDIGEYGAPDELGVFENTKLFKKYVEHLRKIVPSKPLPGTTNLVPRIFIGDESFTLQTSLLRPYPLSATKVDQRKRVFNERLRQPRSVVDETFNMLMRNWRILTRPIECDMETTYDIVKAACCLHNYIIHHGASEGDSEDLPQERRRKRKRTKCYKAFMKHKPTNCRWTAIAGNIREKFVTYFNKE